MDLFIEYNDGHGGHVRVDLQTLAIAMYVQIEDEVKACPELTLKLHRLLVEDPTD